MDERGKQLKKFDLVKGHDFKLGVIISDTFTAHFFDSCMASKAAEVPFDIADPKSYEIEIDDMVLVAVFVPILKGTEAHRIVNLRQAEMHTYAATSYFDTATDSTREILSVKKFAEDLWERDRKERAAKTVSS